MESFPYLYDVSMRTEGKNAKRKKKLKLIMLISNLIIKKRRNQKWINHTGNKWRGLRLTSLCICKVYVTVNISAMYTVHENGEKSITINNCTYVQQLECHINNQIGLLISSECNSFFSVDFFTFPIKKKSIDILSKNLSNYQHRFVIWIGRRGQKLPNMQYFFFVLNYPKEVKKNCNSSLFTV